MAMVWAAVPLVLGLGAGLAALVARRVREETAALAAQVVGLASLAEAAAGVRSDAERLAGRLPGDR